jgi:hypothetical protein
MCCIIATEWSDLRIVSIAIVQDAPDIFKSYKKQHYFQPLKGPATALLDDTQQLLRNWIDQILSVKGWTKARLAKEAGFPTSTITRLFRADYNGSLNMSSVAKIVRASGIAAPTSIGGVDAPLGFSEPAALPYEGARNNETDERKSVWTVASNSLAAIGLMPGDHFSLDQSLQPQPHDLIMVQQYDHQRGTAESLLRIFVEGFAVTPLYLVDKSPKLWIDGANVTIMGVITESWRTHR